MQKKILDKTFKISIQAEEIQKKVKKLAEQLNEELKGKDVLFIGILNGAFMFAADLYRHIEVESQITFLKLASYQGDSSTGKVKRLIGLNQDIKDKTVIVLEDIVDTGITMDSIIKQLKGYEPAEIRFATLLFKPEAYKKEFSIDYKCFEIPNDFIIGYGLDYNGYGRNLASIYTVVEE